MNKMDTQFLSPSTMKNVTKEHSVAHKNTMKEEITKNFMESILDMVYQNV
jgi:hypothetical protein